MSRRTWTDPDRLLDEWAALSQQASPPAHSARSAGKIAGSLGSAAALLIIVAIVGVLLVWQPAGPAGEDVVLLPTHRELNGYPAALLEGTLVREGDCLYAANLYSDTRELVIWPPGTWLNDAADPAQVVARDGRVIAAVGEVVRLGGGQYEDDNLDFLRTLLEQDILDECLGGPYWLAGSAESAWGPPAPATWRVDPGQTPDLRSTSVAVLLTERECAGGRTPEDRIVPPEVRYEPDRIVITVSVRTWPGDCPSNPEYPLLIELDEPIGDRVLVDGGDGGVRWSAPASTTPRTTAEPQNGTLVVSLRYEQLSSADPSPWIGGYAAFATLYDTADVARHTAELSELEAVNWVVAAGTYRLETIVQAVSDQMLEDQEGNAVRQLLGPVATCSTQLEVTAERDTSVIVALHGAQTEESCSISFGTAADPGASEPPAPTATPSPSTEAWAPWDFWFRNEGLIEVIATLSARFPAPHAGEPPAATTLTSASFMDLSQATLRQFDDELEREGAGIWSPSQPEVWLGDQESAIDAFAVQDHVVADEQIWLLAPGEPWSAVRLKSFGTPGGNHAWVLDETLVAYATCTELVTPALRTDGVDEIDTNISLEEDIGDIFIFGDAGSDVRVTFRLSDSECRSHPVLGRLIERSTGD